jgi:hypothetical protein
LYDKAARKEVRSMPRKSVKSLTIDQNVRCQKIYPVEGTLKTTAELKTVAFALTKKEAIHLARVLLAATQAWDDILVTGFRMQKRGDGTYPITVTSFVKE